MIVRYDANINKFEIVESTRLEYNQVKLKLIRKAKNYKFTPQFKRKIWDGSVDNFNGGSISYGLWKEMALALQEIGCKLIVENKEDLPIDRTVTLEKVTKFCDDFFKDHYYLDENGEKKNFDAYKHQVEAAYKVLRNRYCTVEVATSGGKSLIISIVYFYLLRHYGDTKKFLLIVPSLTLVTQFYDDILEYNYGKFKENVNPIDLKVQEIMSDKPRKWHGEGEPNIYISTYQSLSNVTNFGEKFYTQFFGVSCDEAHMAKSASFNKILSRTIKASKYQFGVSGTFQDDEFAEYISIQKLTGPKVIKVRAKELQELGIISWVRILQIHLNHDDPEFLQMLKTIRSNPNSGAEAYRLEGDYVRSSDKRMKFITKLISTMKNNSLVLFNIIEYGLEIVEALKEFLAQQIEEGKVEIHLIYGEIKKAEREEIKKRMELNDGVIRILVASYGTLSTGVSIKNIHNVVFAEGFKSESRIIQSIGRALRLHETKTIASIYDIVDLFTEERGHSSLKNHGEERLLMYKKHEYPYKVKKFML